MNRAMTIPPSIWTVGHSNQDLGRFEQLLAAEKIEFLVDVRSYPHSRYAPHFNREHLERAVAAHGVRYVFLGDALGGRPTREDHYDAEGHALYGPMSEEASFTQAIDRLIAGARDHRLALLCSEADPTDCHRRRLVGKVLTDRGVQLRHILSDGSVHAEDAVALSAERAQCSLLGEEVEPWRSTRSVSHRRRLSTSSAA